MLDQFGIKQTLASFLSLFASAGTLVCCALPALMVSFGMGAALIGLTSSFPQLVWLSQHKLEVFGFSALMITLAGVTLWRSRHFPCPTDPKQAQSCRRLRLLSLWVYGFSVLSFLTGAFFAFIAPYILEK